MCVCVCGRVTVWERGRKRERWKPDQVWVKPCLAGQMMNVQQNGVVSVFRSDPVTSQVRTV